MTTDAISQKLTGILQSAFGYSSFRDGQMEIVSRTANGQHSLVLMPTGMGKSLCFQIPALYFGQQFSEQSNSQTADLDGSSVPNQSVASGSVRPITVVLSPLIALMKDQVDSLVEKGIDATFINSSLSGQERNQRYKNIRNGHYDLVYVVPERFRKEEFCRSLAARPISLLAVDEAHCISQWGHDFRPDYARVGEIRQMLIDWNRDHGRQTLPTIALTATATPEVQDDILVQLSLDSQQVQKFHFGIDRPNLQLEVEEVWDDDQKIRHIMEIRQQFDGCGIVYGTLIKRLMEFSDALWEKRIPHLVYHGDLDPKERRRIQEKFMEEPGHLILATNAFGMGVDKEDIRFVLHLDTPGSLESYYQEIGRAGRDQKESLCRLLYDQRDLATQMEFLGWSNPSGDYFQQLFQVLKDEQESVQAFGEEFLRKKLHDRKKHDRTLDTALAILDRWEVISRTGRGFDISVIGELPAELTCNQTRQEKLLRDQKKLLAMVQYAKLDGDRRAFLNQYFGIIDHE